MPKTNKLFRDSSEELQSIYVSQSKVNTEIAISAIFTPVSYSDPILPPLPLPCLYYNGVGMVLQVCHLLLVHLMIIKFRTLKQATLKDSTETKIGILRRDTVSSESVTYILSPSFLIAWLLIGPIIFSGLGAFSSPFVAAWFAQLPRWSFHFLTSLGITMMSNTILLIFFLKLRCQDGMHIWCCPTLQIFTVYFCLLQSGEIIPGKTPNSDKIFGYLQALLSSLSVLKWKWP